MMHVPSKNKNTSACQRPLKLYELRCQQGHTIRSSPGLATFTDDPPQSRRYPLTESFVARTKTSAICRALRRMISNSDVPITSLGNHIILLILQLTHIMDRDPASRHYLIRPVLKRMSRLPQSSSPPASSVKR